MRDKSRMGVQFYRIRIFMENLTTNLIYVSSFMMIALTSKQIGYFFKQVKLPLISGFLFTGVIAGPYILNLITVEIIASARFVDEVALAIIAFAAGNELYIKELRDRMKSIAWSTAGQILITFPISALAILLLADYLPFMQTMPTTGRIAVALLGGAILVARSPSSVIAIGRAHV